MLSYKYRLQQKVSRIKVKSSAKGDPTIPRDQRFAFSVTFDGALGQESASLAAAKQPLIAFFDKRHQVGQLVD